MSGRQNQTPARILVADDHPTNVFFLTRSLEKQGYTVFSAADGVAAVDLARRELPDLLVLDVMMPERDGLEVCRMLKQEQATSAIPIIFVTARSESEEVAEALALGGSDYITKPFLINEVLARVGVQIRLRQFEKELIARNKELERLSAQLAEMNEELARLTRTDPLTGLLNRRAWHESISLEHERCRRHGTRYGILMIDVDHFKAYNDSVGHQGGDDCLRRVADCIRLSCRSTDAIGRYGGEEFILLCPETDEPGAAALADRIRRNVWEMNLHHPANPTAPRITISVGVSGGEPEDAWEQRIKYADQRLYEAKQFGRNRVRTSTGEAQPAVDVTVSTT